MKKWWIGLLVLAAGGGIFWAATALRGEQPLAAMPQQTSEVTRGTLEVTVSGTGTIQPIVRKAVFTKDAGTVGAVWVQEGDRVKEGTPLLEYEGSDLERQIESQSISLQKRLLDLEAAQERLKESTSDDQRDDLKKEIRKIELDLQLIRSQLAEYREEAEPAPALLAPVTGTLHSFEAESGQAIQAHARVGEIVNFEDLELIVQVDELDVSKIKQGQSAEIRVDAFPDQTFEGHVTGIASEGQNTNGVARFEVTLHLTDSAGIRAGMSAEAEIRVEHKENVLMLPIETVQAVGDRHVVMIPSDGASGPNGGSGTEEGPAGRPQPVTVGVHNESFIEIVSGLDEGDEVLNMTRFAMPDGESFPEGGFPGGGPGSGGFPGGGPGGGGGFPGGGPGGGGGFPGGPGGPR